MDEIIGRLEKYIAGATENLSRLSKRYYGPEYFRMTEDQRLTLYGDLASIEGKIDGYKIAIEEIRKGK